MICALLSFSVIAASMRFQVDCSASGDLLTASLFNGGRTASIAYQPEWPALGYRVVAKKAIGEGAKRKIRTSNPEVLSASFRSIAPGERMTAAVVPSLFFEALENGDYTVEVFYSDIYVNSVAADHGWQVTSMCGAFGSSRVRVIVRSDKVKAFVLWKET